jgi:aminoglycoside/choline kinase family phosphotransferase
MPSLKELNLIFSQLYKDHTRSDSEIISPLAESGSMRKYFRVNGSKGSFIGTYNPNCDENHAFFSFSESFGKLKLPVPQVLVRSADNLSYLQTDFGNVSLFNLVQECIVDGNFTEQLIAHYKQVISYLIQFQIVAHKSLDYSKAFPSPCFSSQSILDDLEYFKYYFLKLHQEILFNDDLLHIDFQNLTTFISQAPSDYFMYRDFQSRNIMMYQGKPNFIDFQGGRKGPLQYDIVSLLYQVKAQLPDSVREELLTFYLGELKKHLPDIQTEFETYYSSFVYLRLFQVLGAYGFRGLIQKKSHFVDSIPYALRTLSDFHSKYPLEEKYPELAKVIQQLSGLKSVYQPKIVTKPHKLKVQINSFSFLKKGIPMDFSGNGGGFVFDCRALPNPGREDRYRMLTGLDKDIIDFMESKNEVKPFFEHIKALSKQSITNYINRGFSSLILNFGCTGGQHRSVFFAEKTYHWAKQKFPDIEIEIQHTELQ